MSGRDERPDRDIPVCSMCGIRPEFWILRSHETNIVSDGWFWLNSNKIIEQGDFSKLVCVPSIEGHGITLNDVVSVTCRPEVVIGVCAGAIHTFVVGEPIFDKVLQQARRSRVEWKR